ncbi:hypothetical protein PVL29_000219 [Vitis rotundifolia]|uniref:RING-type domain-containing protein n=1 Tax=Vitis rotundifolia TaxID=103349 RepID=A0AA39AIW2_VITRO|nr:hypothetical protein PVL29_000219 [Vitis rotundifolia]
MLQYGDEEPSISHYKPKIGCEEGEEECVVCLCKIEGGEEIRELRCDHLFHRVCQDRWLQYKHTTCPLCCGPLARCSTGFKVFVESGTTRLNRIHLNSCHKDIKYDVMHKLGIEPVRLA